VCYDSNARPPDLPVPHGSAQGEDLVLTAADGNRFAAYFAHPVQETMAQVLIYPDVRGLYQFYKELALRLAEVGVRALAIDYFGRTAGLTPRDDTFEYMPHVQQMQLSTFFNDVTAALAYLTSLSSTHYATFTLGFCRGGSLCLLTGTRDFELNGIIAFYSGLSRKVAESEGTVLEEASKIHYPVLDLFGGADQGIPPEQVQELDDTLDKAGVEHELVVYPGAPHSFFDRKSAEYAEASADAWKRVLTFISAHSMSPG
jgi:carboxymethylenebutenolidase